MPFHRLHRTQQPWFILMYWYKVRTALIDEVKLYP
jgi:hypothetical protein